MEEHLVGAGLSFSAFDILRSSLNEESASKVKQKVVARLGKDIRRDFIEEHDLDVAKITYGCYCIGLDGGFEINYELCPSDIVYIGSGAVYGRMKSHLSGKLFDFASKLRAIPFRLYVADLSRHQDGQRAQRLLEQAMLARFCERYEPLFPLLNAKNASSGSHDGLFETGWDVPVQRSRGRNTTGWLLKPTDAEDWKGKLK